MTVPARFDGNIDGDSFAGNHPLDRWMLLHAAALVVYEKDPLLVGVDSAVNVRSEHHEEGAGSVTVREVLEWARTDEGQATLKAIHSGAASYLKLMADDLLKEG